MKSNSKKKILWISHFVFFPPHGGARIRSFNLFKSLSKEYDIDLILLDKRKKNFPGLNRENEIQEIKKFAASLKFQELKNDNNFIKIFLLIIRNIFSKLPVTSFLLFDHKVGGIIKDQVNKTNHNAIYLDTIDLAIYDSFFNLKNKPIIVGHQNIESSLLQKMSKQKNFILSKYFSHQGVKTYNLEKNYCSNKNNIVVSINDKELLQSITSNSKIEIISNGVDIDYFDEETDRFSRMSKNLIWVGGMHWFPNKDAISFFINEIFPRILELDADVKLSIVGSSPPTIPKELTNSIYVTGYVNDIREYVKNSDVMIVPIRIGGGSRLKILNSFAGKIPVISTSIGCEGLEVKDNLHLLVANEPQEFTEKTVTLLRDKQTAKKLASNAFELVSKRYSWDKIGKEFVRVFNDITNI